MTEFAEEAPSERSGSSLADWIEILMFVEGTRRLSRTALRRRLRSVGSTDLDFEVELVLSEIERRRRIAPRTYPFERAARGIRRLDDVAPTIYAFLLLLSAPFSPVRREGRYSEIDLWFDGLVLNCLLAYLGPGSTGVRFGWPASGQRPAAFPDAVKWLAGMLGLSEGAGTPSPEVKDGGVDVVAWKRFADQRSGFLIALAQVTARDDWRAKLGDVLVRRWHGWIDFGADPITALAIPFAVSMDWERWDDLRRATTLLLDRLRLCEFVRTDDFAEPDGVQAWVDQECQKMLLNPA